MALGRSPFRSLALRYSKMKLYYVIQFFILIRLTLSVPTPQTIHIVTHGLKPKQVTVFTVLMSHVINRGWQVKFIEASILEASALATGGSQVARVFQSRKPRFRVPEGIEVFLPEVGKSHFSPASRMCVTSVLSSDADRRRPV